MPAILKSVSTSSLEEKQGTGESYVEHILISGWLVEIDLCSVSEAFFAHLEVCENGGDRL